MEKKDRAENIEALASKMYYSGFSEITVDQLQKEFDEAVKNKKENFNIVFDKKIDNNAVKASLNFDFSENKQRYYFNNFDLLLKKEGKEETLQQKFFVGYGSNYTLKEGYNMLDGRSVYKHLITTDKIDREKKNEFKGWVKLDFNDANESGNFKIQRVNNFDVTKTIEEYAIKGIENDKYKQNLINSLKKGNQATVTIDTSAGERKMVIEAHPTHNSIKLYDENMKPILLSMKRKVEKNIPAQNSDASQKQSGEDQPPNLGHDKKEQNQPTQDTTKKVQQNDVESSKKSEDNKQQTAQKKTAESKKQNSKRSVRV